MESKPRTATPGSFKKGNKMPGQGKRGPNKTTVAAKESIALAAEGLGGTNRLIKWCKEDPLNERAFWASIYPKLLPLQISGEIKIDMSDEQLEAKLALLLKK